MIINAAIRSTKKRSPEGYTHTCCTMGMERERTRTDEKKKKSFKKNCNPHTQDSCACLYVCVCVWKQEREREGKIEDKSHTIETTCPLDGVVGAPKAKVDRNSETHRGGTCDDNR